MNLSALAVITTCTSQPAFVNWLAKSAALHAAMDPVTPKTTFLSRSCCLFLFHQLDLT